MWGTSLALERELGHGRGGDLGGGGDVGLPGRGEVQGALEAAAEDLLHRDAGLDQLLLGRGGLGRGVPDVDPDALGRLRQLCLLAGVGVGERDDRGHLRVEVRGLLLRVGDRPGADQERLLAGLADPLDCLLGADRVLAEPLTERLAAGLTGLGGVAVGARERPAYPGADLASVDLEGGVGGGDLNSHGAPPRTGWGWGPRRDRRRPPPPEGRGPRERRVAWAAGCSLPGPIVRGTRRWS
jgi:hypothetical protein